MGIAEGYSTTNCASFGSVHAQSHRAHATEKRHQGSLNHLRRRSQQENALGVSKILNWAQCDFALTEFLEPQMPIGPLYCPSSVAVSAQKMSPLNGSCIKTLLEGVDYDPEKPT